MADDSTLNPGAAGDKIRLTQKGGASGPKTQHVIIDKGGSGAEDVTAVDFATQATLALIKAKTDNLDVALSTRTKPADTQPVSAASLPLPAGASTEATLALIKAKTDNIDVLLSTRTKPGDTQPVSAAALPLPAGAATEAGNLAAINTATGAQADAEAAANGSVIAILKRIRTLLASVPVTGAFFQATQPVSGTVTSNQGAAQAQGTAGWPVQPYGMSDTLFASGNVLGAVAGTAICTLTTPAAGTYRVDISTMCSGDGVTAPVFQNMEFRRGAVMLVSVLDGVANRLATAPTGNADNLQNLRITLDGTTNLSINATANYGAADNAIARIIATRIF